MRRVFTFRLKTLLGVIAILAIILASAHHRTASRRNELKWIISHGGQVEYSPEEQDGSLWNSLARIILNDQRVEVIYFTEGAIDDDDLARIAKCFPEAAVLTSGSPLIEEN